MDTKPDAIDLIWTVRQAAEKFGVVDSYIRRVCIQHNIGRKVGRDRLLTDEDLTAIKMALPNA